MQVELTVQFTVSYQLQLKSDSNSRWRPAAILENFKRPYLSDAYKPTI